MRGTEEDSRGTKMGKSGSLAERRVWDLELGWGWGSGCRHGVGAHGRV